MNTCPRGETDIMTGFGPVVGGSNPSEDTQLFILRLCMLCGQFVDNGCIRGYKGHCPLYP